MLTKLRPQRSFNHGYRSRTDSGWSRALVRVHSLRRDKVSEVIHDPPAFASLFLLHILLDPEIVETRYRVFFQSASTLPGLI